MNIIRAFGGCLRLNRHRLVSCPRYRSAIQVPSCHHAIRSDSIRAILQEAAPASVPERLAANLAELSQIRVRILMVVSSDANCSQSRLSKILKIPPERRRNP
jgi:hypothetical protein